MRKINKIIIHCSATRENAPVSVETIKNWHIWPKDYFTKNKQYAYTRYLGIKYYGRATLPEKVRDKHGRAFNDIGYHKIFDVDGTMYLGRPIEKMGAHCTGQNWNSIGYCYIGGLDKDGKPKDTRTDAQKEAMKAEIEKDKIKYGFSEVKGHRDYSPDLNKNGKIDKWEWIKVCPCFDVKSEFY